MFIELTRENDKKVTVNINKIVEFSALIEISITGTHIYLDNHKELKVKEPYGYLQEKIYKYQRII